MFIKPSRLTSYWVGETPMVFAKVAGARIEGPDSLPMATVTRLAATAVADPPLEPPGTRAGS
jgi:hypothetical protein